jgi:hypothetical protein
MEVGDGTTPLEASPEGTVDGHDGSGMVLNALDDSLQVFRIKFKS